MLAQGISGTVQWTLDDDGTLYFTPVDGKEGTFDDSIGYIGCGAEEYNGYDWNKYCKKIKRIKSYGLIHLAENSSCMFFGCSCLISLDLNNFDTNKVTTMESMFEGCSFLTSLDLCNFDTSHVTNMAGMFSGCYSLRNLNVTSFDTSRVTDMHYMFYDCSSLSIVDSLKNWNTGNVTDMSWMFKGCSSLSTIDALKNWNIQSVRTMSFMFYGCSSLKKFDLIHFDVKKITDVTAMFWDCDSLATIELSNLNRNIVLGLPINETSTLSFKWHKINTDQEYSCFELADNWNNSFEGIWSRKKISKSIPTDELKVTISEGKTITISLKDKMLTLKLDGYSVQGSYE